MNDGSIPPEMYRKTADTLMEAMSKGLGGTSFAYEDPRNLLGAYLQDSIHTFSAAKSIYEMRYFTNMMVREDGSIRSFEQFRNKVMDKGYEFNVHHLRTEYNTALASAQSAKQWEDFQSNDVEYLQYSTVHDDRVRESHALLDGLTMKADSPAWKSYWPPLDWNCRCHIIPGIAANASAEKQGGKMLKDAATNPLFANNQAVEKQILSNDHPVYSSLGKNPDGTPKTKSLTAVKNYGLPPVKKILMDAPDMPNGDFLKVWKTFSADDGNIILEDKINSKILFDINPTTQKKYDRKYFKSHIFQNDDNRKEYAHTFPELVQNPDEIWSFRENGKLIRIYLKFYANNPIALIVTDKRSGLVAETLYRLKPGRYEDLRKGALLYKNR